LGAWGLGLLGLSLEPRAFPLIDTHPEGAYTARNSNFYFLEVDAGALRPLRSHERQPSQARPETV